MSETEASSVAAGTGPLAGITSEAMPPIDWIRDFTPQWLEAWNSHEVDRLLALMTEDIEYRDDSWPKVMRGHADVREFLEATWRATPDMTFELLSGPYVLPGEPRAAFHWRGWGTHSGLLEPPGFAPTGRRWELDGVEPSRVSRRSRLQVADRVRHDDRLAPARPGARGRWAR